MSSSILKKPINRSSGSNGSEMNKLKHDAKEPKGGRLFVDKKRVEAALHANSKIRQALREVVNKSEINGNASNPDTTNSEVVGLKSKMHVLEQRYLTGYSDKENAPNTPAAAPPKAQQDGGEESSPATDKDSVATPSAAVLAGAVAAAPGNGSLSAELRATLDRLSIDVSDLKKTNEDLMEQLNASKRCRLKKDVEISSLKSVNDTLQQHQQALKAENESLHRGVASVRAENNRLQHETLNLRMENENLVRQLGFLQTELDTIATSVATSSSSSSSSSSPPLCYSYGPSSAEMVRGRRSSTSGSGRGDESECSFDSNWLVIDESSESEGDQTGDRVGASIGFANDESSTCADNDATALQRMLQATFREKLEAEKQITVLNERLAQLQLANDSISRGAGAGADALLLTTTKKTTTMARCPAPSTSNSATDKHAGRFESGLSPVAAPAPQALTDFPLIFEQGEGRGKTVLSPVGVSRRSSMSRKMTTTTSTTTATTSTTTATTGTCISRRVAISPSELLTANSDFNVDDDDMDDDVSMSTSLVSTSVAVDPPFDDEGRVDDDGGGGGLSAAAAAAAAAGRSLVTFGEKIGPPPHFPSSRTTATTGGIRRHEESVTRDLHVSFLQEQHEEEEEHAIDNSVSVRSEQLSAMDLHSNTLRNSNRRTRQQQQLCTAGRGFSHDKSITSSSSSSSSGRTAKTVMRGGASGKTTDSSSSSSAAPHTGAKHHHRDYIPHKTVFVDLDSSDFLQNASNVSYAFSDWHRLDDDDSPQVDATDSASRLNFLTTVDSVDDGCDRSDVFSIGVSEVSAAFTTTTNHGHANNLSIPSSRQRREEAANASAIFSHRPRIETPEDIRRARRAAGLSDRSRSYHNYSSSSSSSSFSLTSSTAATAGEPWRSGDSDEESSGGGTNQEYRRNSDREYSEGVDASSSSTSHCTPPPVHRRNGRQQTTRLPCFPTPDAAMHAPDFYDGSGTDIASDVSCVGESSPSPSSPCSEREEQEEEEEEEELHRGRAAALPSIVGMIFSLFQAGGGGGSKREVEVEGEEVDGDDGDCESEDDEDFTRSVFSNATN